jgi:hypothetical protein
MCSLPAVIVVLNITVRLEAQKWKSPSLVMEKALPYVCTRTTKVVFLEYLLEVLVYG